MRAMFVTLAMGRCSLAPAEALVTVPVTLAARRSGMTTPFAPAASAVRRIAPRLCGSSTPSRTITSEYSARLRRDHVFEIVVLLGRRNRDHALVRGVARQVVEFGPRQKAHGHAQPPAVFDQPLQANVVALLRHAHPLKGAPPRLQRLGYGVDAIDVVHEYQCTESGCA